MFGLVNVGWLMFRETETSFLIRDFRLSPATSSVLDWRVGVYLSLLTAAYSLPLWVHAAVTSWQRGSREERPPWSWRSLPQVGWDALLCGGLLAILLVFRSRTSLDFIYFQF
jgi:hypothetical protein